MTAADSFPSCRATETHFESFHNCHSLARAETDLCMIMAFEALESFAYPGASLVVDGTTCLSRNYGLLRCFSEEVDLRIVLDGDPACPKAQVSR